MKINNRELATILAALRIYQARVITDDYPATHIATDGGTLKPLTEKEIDNLYQRINTGE